MRPQRALRSVAIVAVTKSRQHQRKIGEALLVLAVARFAQGVIEAVRPFRHHLLMVGPARRDRERDTGLPAPDHLGADGLACFLVIGDAGVLLPERRLPRDFLVERVYILAKFAPAHEGAMAGEARRLGNDREFLALVDLAENELAGLERRPA